MAELAAVAVLEQRPQLLQHARAIELLRRTRVGVRERHVGRVAWLDRERHADDLRLHVVERGRLGVEGKQVGGAKRVEPAREMFLRQDQFVVPSRRPLLLLYLSRIRGRGRAQRG
jgi:hypothetical protein